MLRKLYLNFPKQQVSILIKFITSFLGTIISGRSLDIVNTLTSGTSWMTSWARGSSYIYFYVSIEINVLLNWIESTIELFDKIALQKDKKDKLRNMHIAWGLLYTKITECCLKWFKTELKSNSLFILIRNWRRNQLSRAIIQSEVVLFY